MVFGQSYAPEPGQPGTTAIHKDSSLIQYWGDSVTVIRGYLNISNTALGYATYGVEDDALGSADGAAVVSLGDGGEALYFFEYPVSDGPGPDFAIFENGFIDHYMELAFVEVSSDGVNFFRFDAISEIPTDTQLTNFSTSNCAYIHNLAGKYRMEYGTPFDLEELQGIPGLDINSISHIKIIDVVGSIDANWGSMDSQGTIINDPFPTEFESCGFDLDAIGVINSQYLSIESVSDVLTVYPNPFNDKLNIVGNGMVIIYDARGNMLIQQECTQELTIDTSGLINGVYFVDFGGKYIKMMKL